MDPQFATILIRVLMLGGAIAIIGGGALVIGFRAIGRPFRATVMIASVLAFVLLCCLILLRLSFVK